jgi:F420-non-reducing hydrogenase iron-sulfur subunit
MDKKNESLNLAIFFCRRLDPAQDRNRRPLEKERGKKMKFFPLPCTGRIDPLQLMKALEEGADMVYLVTCAEEGCRYGEGNLRAKRRLAYTRGLVGEVGLEPERLQLIMTSPGTATTIDKVARDLLSRDAVAGPSPLRAH